MSVLTRATLGVATCVLALAATGCSNSPETAPYLTESATPATVATTSTDAPTPQSTAVKTVVVTETQASPARPESCGYADAYDAVRAYIDEVRPATWNWDVSSAIVSGYDPCADLSWAIVTIPGATGASPNQIMLFHRGEYLGTATLDAYAFVPTVTRTSDSSIAVIYHYLLPGESTATRSGKAYATFTWSDAEGRVIMEGEVPPTT